MFRKMLKLTMVLFILMAFFVAPPSILSDGSNGDGSGNNGSGPSSRGSGWGTPVYDKACKGTHDHDIDGSCPQTSLPSECTGSVKYYMKSESEGCVTESYGSRCYTKTVWELIGTAPCVIGENDDGTYCTRDISNLKQESFTDCKTGAGVYFN